MIWEAITFGIATTFFYFIIKKYLIKKEIKKNTIALYDQYHKDIKEFIDLVISHRKKIRIELQNQNFYFISEAKLYTTDYIHVYQYDEKFEKEYINNNSDIDIKSLKIIFYSSDHDYDGPTLLTDKSGAIFLYDFNNKSPKIKKIYASIWDVFKNKEQLIIELKKSNTTLIYSNIEPVDKFIPIDQVIKFSVEEFEQEDYKIQLDELFSKSKDELKLNSVIWNSHKSINGENIECLIEINNHSEKVIIDNLGWYDLKFPNNINAILKKINSSYRISLVHENKWDEIYGVKLSKLNEFELLKRHMLIVE